ncbi:MAG: hypothetical protein WBH57_06625 [Anaerolineae bacterium]
MEENKIAVQRIEMAMQIEREGREFYLDAAERTEDDNRESDVAILGPPGGAAHRVFN